MPGERGMPQDVKKHFTALRLLVLGSLPSLSGANCASTGDKAPEMDPGFCMECHQTWKGAFHFI
jgi:hypothetical protein